MAVTFLSLTQSLSVTLSGNKSHTILRIHEAAVRGQLCRLNTLTTNTRERRNKTDKSNYKVDIFHMLISVSVTGTVASASGNERLWTSSLSRVSARVSRETSVCLFMYTHTHTHWHTQFAKTVRQTSAGS